MALTHMPSPPVYFGDLKWTADGYQLDISGPTDGYQIIKYRKEQKYLRDTLLKGKSSTCCAICGEDLPPSLLVNANVKKRASASEVERKNQAIDMPMLQTWL